MMLLVFFCRKKLSTEIRMMLGDCYPVYKNNQLYVYPESSERIAHHKKMKLDFKKLWVDIFWTFFSQNLKAKKIEKFPYGNKSIAAKFSRSAIRIMPKKALSFRMNK